MIFLSLIMARGGACTKPPAALFFSSFLSRNCTQTEPSFWKRTKERVEKFARNYFASAFWRNKRTELEENWGGFEIFKEMLGRKEGVGQGGLQSDVREARSADVKRKAETSWGAFFFLIFFFFFVFSTPPHRGEGPRLNFSLFVLCWQVTWARGKMGTWRRSFS